MKLCWGIIGAGDIARKQTARAIQMTENAELVAVMSRSMENAQAFAGEFGAARAYDSTASLLGDPAVEAVYIATPVYLHAENVLHAAEAGKHVLVEKPMGISAAECRKMIDRCEAGGLKLMVCYYQRFNARHQKVRELVQNGAIGQVTMAQVRQAFLYPPDPDNWRQDPARSGGGALMDVGVHCIDTLRFILGEVESVSALVDTLAFDYAVEDTATLLLCFKNGVQAVVSAAFSIAGIESSTLDYLEISGTGGRIWTSPLQAKDSSGNLRLLTSDGEQEINIDQSTHESMIKAFGDSVLHGKPSPVPGQEGLAGMQVIEAAYKSSQTGCRIVLEGKTR